MKEDTKFTECRGIMNIEKYLLKLMLLTYSSKCIHNVRHNDERFDRNST